MFVGLLIKRQFMKSLYGGKVSFCKVTFFTYKVPVFFCKMTNGKIALKSMGIYLKLNQIFKTNSSFLLIRKYVTLKPNKHTNKKTSQNELKRLVNITNGSQIL